MLRFTTFEEFVSHLKVIYSLYDRYFPSHIRDNQFKLVLKCLQDSSSSVHYYSNVFSYPVYVVFGKHFCYSLSLISESELEEIKDTCAVFLVYFTSTNIIVKSF